VRNPGGTGTCDGNPRGCFRACLLKKLILMPSLPPVFGSLAVFGRPVALRHRLATALPFSLRRGSIVGLAMAKVKMYEPALTIQGLSMRNIGNSAVRIAPCFVRGLTEGLNLEFERHGITVTDLGRPGPEGPLDPRRAPQDAQPPGRRAAVRLTADDEEGGSAAGVRPGQSSRSTLYPCSPRLWQSSSMWSSLRVSRVMSTWASQKPACMKTRSCWMRITLPP